MGAILEKKREIKQEKKKMMRFEYRPHSFRREYVCKLQNLRNAIELFKMCLGDVGGIYELSAVEEKDAFFLLIFRKLTK